MAALPVVSGEQAVRAFQKAGWRKDRQSGSHWLLARFALSFVLRE